MELPEDIDKIASDIVKRSYHDEDEPDFALYLAIGRAILAERQRCAAPPFPIKAKWVGDERLFQDSDIEILACDAHDTSVPARMAIWVRWWPSARDCPSYRSCDLSDAQIVNEEDERRLDEFCAAIPSPTVQENER